MVLTLRVSFKQLSMTLCGLLLLTLCQICIDIPGMDLPDLKDLPDMIDTFQAV